MQNNKIQYQSLLIAVGAYLPKRILTNKELENIVDTSDQWITKRTGIKQRHIADEKQTTADMAIIAAKRAIKNAKIKTKNIDLIICATTTPDNTFPATATKIQAKLNINQGAAFDVQAVCSGFIYALSIADAFIKTGTHKSALVIGADAFSKIIDWKDRETCVLFGDGAGAVILTAQKINQNKQQSQNGIILCKIRADGKYADKLYVDGGPGSTKTVGHVKMKGAEVFKHAVQNLTHIIKDIIKDANISQNDIDWIIPHQANQRIIDAVANKIGVPKSKVISTIHKHGNTSAASIPIALNNAVEEGKIKNGDLLLLEAMGGGFTWGSAIVKWGKKNTPE